MTQLNEYSDYPKWIDILTDEQRYEMYLEIKRTLPMLTRIKDDSTKRLEQAIADYEKRHGIIP